MMLKGVRKCSVDSERQKSITKELAIFLGSTNTPISIVENDRFKKLIQTLDNRYELPGRGKMGKDITVITKMKEVISSYLQGRRKELAHHI